MLDFESRIESEQRKRQRRILALTPDQRLERFLSLQAAAYATLASNPDALAAFLRRNYQARKESRVRELERQLRGADSKDTDSKDADSKDAVE